MTICDELGEDAINNSKNTIYGKMLADVYSKFRIEKGRIPMPEDFVEDPPARRAGTVGRRLLITWLSLVLTWRLLATKVVRRYSSPVARTLYNHGMKEVANSQEARAFMQYSRDLGLQSGALETAAELGFRFF
jgi:hypothetical protein